MTRFATALLTQTGCRASNEDRAGFAMVGEVGCWLVADGLGGHRHGNIAAETALSAMLDAFRAKPEASPQTLRALLAAGQSALHMLQARRPELARMRTTAVALLADARHACWAHAGDSRLYLFRDGRICARTRDHSVAQTLVNLGELDEAALRQDPDRSRLLRDLGGAGPVRATVTETPTILSAGDVFLLCSDGFWEPLPEQAMEAALTPAIALPDWLDTLAAQLTARADPKQDNYTALAVRVL
ncbi:MAG: PP2C family protein-serine/threonine phosphatase [Candidatus Methylumidiphilus sp.]